MSDQQATQRILGIDPGLNTTGYAVIELQERRARLIEAGIVRSTRSKPLESRLDQIYTGVVEVMTALKPQCLSLEEVFSHYQRPKTAILMGHARGVINLAAARQGMPVHSYSATRVKSVLTGNGRAPKSQVQLTVGQHLDLAEPPTPHDIADAMAIALCHGFLGTPGAMAATT